METIKAIGFSICITIVVTSIFSMLLPNTKLDKVIKFAISLFFLTGIISPFFSSDLKFHVDIEDVISNQNITKLDQTFETQFISAAQTNLESSIQRMLKKDGANVIKVEILINKMGEDNISISKLMVYIDKDSNNSSKKIEEIVKKEVGITPTIIIV